MTFLAPHNINININDARHSLLLLGGGGTGGGGGGGGVGKTSHYGEANNPASTSSSHSILIPAINELQQLKTSELLANYLSEKHHLSSSGDGFEKHHLTERFTSERTSRSGNNTTISPSFAARSFLSDGGDSEGRTGNESVSAESTYCVTSSSSERGRTYGQHEGSAPYSSPSLSVSMTESVIKSEPGETTSNNMER